jgi:hypothetical protein
MKREFKTHWSIEKSPFNIRISDNSGEMIITVIYRYGLGFHDYVVQDLRLDVITIVDMLKHNRKDFHSLITALAINAVNRIALKAEVSEDVLDEIMINYQRDK